MNEATLNTLRIELVKILTAERAKTISYITDMETYCYEIVQQADTLAYMTDNAEHDELEKPPGSEEGWEDAT